MFGTLTHSGCCYKHRNVYEDLEYYLIVYSECACIGFNINKNFEHVAKEVSVFLLPNHVEKLETVTNFKTTKKRISKNLIFVIFMKCDYLSLISELER